MQTRQLMDRATGEVVYALVPVEKALKGRNFFMAFLAAFEHLARNPLPVRERQVFDYLIGHLDMDNWLHVKQAEVATELGLDPGDVSRAFRQLVAKGLLDAGPATGRTLTYRLSAHVGWRGKAPAHRKALAEAARRWGRAE